MHSAGLESSAFFVIVPVPQLASPSTVYRTPSIAASDGAGNPIIPLCVPTGFLYCSEVGPRPRHPCLRKSLPSLSSGVGVSILDSVAKPHAASTSLAIRVSHVMAFFVEAGSIVVRSVVWVLYRLSLFEDFQGPLSLRPPPES